VGAVLGSVPERTAPRSRGAAGSAQPRATVGERPALAAAPVHGSKVTSVQREPSGALAWTRRQGRMASRRRDDQRVSTPGRQQASGPAQASAPRAAFLHPLAAPEGAIFS